MAGQARPVEEVVNPTVNCAFWCGRRVLLTGHTGFKGAWLAIWLARLGARVTGLALAPPETPALFSLARVDELVDHIVGDIRETASVQTAFDAAQPEIVFHLAAQALVREGYRSPLTTYSTNVIGTAQVLEGCYTSQTVRAVVVVTTDKVYRSVGTAAPFFPYREDDALGGHDPYSASKAAAEIVTASYREAFLAERGVAVATARAGNVIGGGDWSVDRLIPDAIKSWRAGAPLRLRNPRAVRPWQHVLEPLAAYLCLAQALYGDRTKAGSYNFGPFAHEAATVGDVVDLARATLGSGQVMYDDGDPGPYEAAWLALETVKARQTLGIVPRWNLRQAVKRTMEWYARLEAGGDARALCYADIEAYHESLSNRVYHHP